MKGQNITKEKWDKLIILDACRYDFFEKNYKDFLEGNLEKRKSRGTSTAEWLVKTFPDKYNITYVSSNANINSLNVPTFWGKKWVATKHFKKIIDVWDFGWDDEVMTVPPDNVNKAYIKNKIDNRAIIHYNQPHAPYFGFDHKFIRTSDPSKVDGKTDFTVPRFLKKKFVDFGFRFEKNITKIKSWKIRKKMGMAPRNPVEEVWRKCSLEEIHNYYEENLRRVLKYASELVGNMDGKIVITADHGEAFGENGVWEHPSETYIPILLEVPWLVIEK